MAKNDKMSETHRRFLKYTSMTTKELAEATKEFDREFIADTFGPPPPDAAALMETCPAQARPPAMGKGAKRISVSVEEGLLAESDALARRLKIPPAQLIAKCLRAAGGARRTLSGNRRAAQNGAHRDDGLPGPGVEPGQSAGQPGEGGGGVQPSADPWRGHEHVHRDAAGGRASGAAVVPERRRGAGDRP